MSSYPIYNAHFIDLFPMSCYPVYNAHFIDLFPYVHQEGPMIDAYYLWIAISMEIERNSKNAQVAGNWMNRLMEKTIYLYIS